jgi:hypothetical protein
MNDIREKGFVEKLQSLDDRQKRTILIVATAIIMVIVIYIWLGYFNSIVASVPQGQDTADQSAPADQVTPAPQPAETMNPLQRMESGMANMYQSMTGFFGSLGKILQSPRQYIVNPK